MKSIDELFSEVEAEGLALVRAYEHRRITDPAFDAEERQKYSSRAVRHDIDVTEVDDCEDSESEDDDEIE